jgi:phosphoadenosine phosphosulfate reductase
MNNDAFLQVADETRGLDAPGLLSWALRRFGARVALASSFSLEDQVLTDMLAGMTSRPRVFTLDTGRLPQETYDTMAETMSRYGLRMEILFPERAEVESLVSRHGPNLFYRSVQDRKACCHVRKVVPLRRKLAELDAWITGMRREQSVTRQDVSPVEWDSAHGKLKINPLAEWTLRQVQEYVQSHSVPVNPLQSRGYLSIGCAPCTRPVEEGDDLRSGRWWWESPEHKECGLHRNQAARPKEVIQHGPA